MKFSGTFKIVKLEHVPITPARAPEDEMTDVTLKHLGHSGESPIACVPELTIRVQGRENARLLVPGARFSLIMSLTEMVPVVND